MATADTALRAMPAPEASSGSVKTVRLTAVRFSTELWNPAGMMRPVE